MNKIKQKRMTLGLSSEEFASRMGVLPTTVSMWEMDDHPPGVAMYPHYCTRIGLQD